MNAISRQAAPGCWNLCGLHTCPLCARIYGAGPEAEAQIQARGGLSRCTSHMYSTDDPDAKLVLKKGVEVDTSGAAYMEDHECFCRAHGQFAHMRRVFPGDPPRNEDMSAMMEDGPMSFDDEFLALTRASCFAIEEGGPNPARDRLNVDQLRDSLHDAPGRAALESVYILGGSDGLSKLVIERAEELRAMGWATSASGRRFRKHLQGGAP